MLRSDPSTRTASNRTCPAARVSGLAILVVGLWGGIVPFAGPTFGYRMGATPAWVWSESHATLHVAPALAAVLGGLLMLGRRRARSALGAGLALAGGTWFVIAPSLHDLWAGGGSGMMMGHSATMAALSAIGYHYGTGVVIAVLAGWALGRMSARSAPALIEVEHRRESAAPSMIDA